MSFLDSGLFPSSSGGLLSNILRMAQSQPAASAGFPQTPQEKQSLMGMMLGGLTGGIPAYVQPASSPFDNAVPYSPQTMPKSAVDYSLPQQASPVPSSAVAGPPAAGTSVPLPQTRPQFQSQAPAPASPAAPVSSAQAPLSPQSPFAQRMLDAAQLPANSQPTAGQIPSQSPAQFSLPSPPGSGLGGLLGGVLSVIAPRHTQALMNIQNLAYQRQLQQFQVQNTAQALMQRNPNLTASQAIAMAMNPAMLGSAIKPQVVAPGGQLVTPIDLMGGKPGAANSGAPSASPAGVYQNSSGILNDKTLTTMAGQYLAGDPSVLQNLGRTAAGAINVQRLRDRIVQLMNERGISPQDQATKMAEFKGLQAAQTTLGNRQAVIGMAGSEVQQMAPLVLQASAAVDRTRFPALNNVIIAARQGTGDPNVVRLGQSINSLINAYARAINPNGVGTVSDKDHARELLSSAWSQGQISAGVNQLMNEIAAAKRAPGITKQEIHDLYSGESSSANNGGWTDLGNGVRIRQKQ